MTPRDAASLADIKRAAERAIRYLGSKDSAALHADDQAESAILHQLTIIGEAARRLSKELLEANPQVPWTKVMGTRHRIVHEYDEVDLAIVVRITREHLPTLVKQVSALLPPPPPP